MLYQAKRDFDQALSLFHNGLQLFIELGDLYEQANCHYRMYELYKEMGNIEQSLRAKQQAVELNAVLNHADLEKKLA